MKGEIMTSTSRRRLMIVLTIIAALAALGIFILPKTNTQPQIAQVPTATPEPPTPTPTLEPTPTPTATPTPQEILPPNLLYKADWSQGLSDWSKTADWKIDTGGMLISDGSYSDFDYSNENSPTLQRKVSTTS